MEHASAEQWLAAYERLWRSPGTEGLTDLFTADATYLPSPWVEPLRGLDALARFWEAERESPHEDFTMASDVVVVDAERAAAVVRVEVEYGEPEPSRWRNLWVLRFAGDGRCVAFEEWPFAPGQPDGH